MAATAQAAVEQQAGVVMDQARDFVKRVGESVGGIVESGTRASDTDNTNK
jgi:hypothetical protein